MNATVDLTQQARPIQGLHPTASFDVLGASGDTVWPWQAEPNRRWSLQDMMRFFADKWLRLSTILMTIPASHLLVVQDKGETEGLEDNVRRHRDSLVSGLESESARLPFSPAVKGLISRFCEQLSEADLKSHNNREVLQALGAEVNLCVMTEFQSQIFLVVDPARSQFFSQTEPLFGQQVETQFPDAAKDIAAAGRCYALDEWTACVFHLMRVLEHGLRAAAIRFNVPFQSDSWHKVIKGIEDGLTALRNKQGLTAQDRHDITHYSDAATQFRHFKDAWRNHVSHGREHYDERDAEKVMAHVREFMQHLADASAALS